jgi:hypothetical protein
VTSIALAPRDRRVDVRADRDLAIGDAALRPYHLAQASLHLLEGGDRLIDLGQPGS